MPRSGRGGHGASGNPFFGGGFTDSEIALIRDQIKELQAKGFFNFDVSREESGAIRIDYQVYPGEDRHTILNGQLTPDNPLLWTTDLLNLPGPLDKKPLYPWARAKENGLTAAYHVDQMVMVMVIANIHVRRSFEVALVDDDGLSLFGPEIPPAAIIRRTTQFEVDPLPSDDAVDDPTLQFRSGNWWDDASINAPIIGDEVTGGFRWSLRLSRTPTPHWVFRIGADFSDYVLDTSDPENYGILAHFIGSGGGLHHGTTGILREEGSSYDHGHYSLESVWHTGGTTTPLTAINGGRDELLLPKFLSSSENATAGANTGSIYFREPFGLVGDTQIFTDEQMPPALDVMCENPLSTVVDLTDPTTWDSTPLGGQRMTQLGNLRAAGTKDPPVHYGNYDFYAHHSQLGYDNTNSQWFYRVWNFATATRSFFGWALGR